MKIEFVTVIFRRENSIQLDASEIGTADSVAACEHYLHTTEKAMLYVDASQTPCSPHSLSDRTNVAKVQLISLYVRKKKLPERIGQLFDLSSLIYF